MFERIPFDSNIMGGRGLHPRHADSRLGHCGQIARGATFEEILKEIIRT